MDAIGEAIGTGLGGGIAKGIAVGLAYVVIGALVLLASSLFFGALFSVLAIYSYKREQRKTFLAFAILADLFLSLLAAILLSALFTGAPFAVFTLAPILFVGGLVYIFAQYKKL